LKLRNTEVRHNNKTSLEHIFIVQHHQKHYQLNVTIGKVGSETIEELKHNMASEMFNETFEKFGPFVKDRFISHIDTFAITDKILNEKMTNELNDILLEYGMKPRIIDVYIQDQ
jgi:hypothetical protein